MENLVMEQKSFTENLLAYLRKRLKKEVRVDFHNVIKTNDVLYHSIVLVDETDERKCYPNFYIEELFQKYKAGKSVEEIGDEMIELNDMKGLPRTFTAEMLTENIGNYQLLMQKKKLFVKLLNKERNSKFLEGKAYLDYLDLAIVFYCLVGKDDDQMASVAIPKELANQWEITLEEALDSVLDVMKETLPVKRLILPDLLKELCNKDSFSAFMNPPVIGEDDIIDIFVFTNTLSINGASVILYKNLLRDFAMEQGVEKLYMLPSSIHEYLIVPVKEGESLRPDELKHMVQEVNCTCVSNDEVMSDNLYIYELDKDTVSIWEE